jgi:hypothetical protein
MQGQADMTVDWQHNLQVLKWKFDRPQMLMLPRRGIIWRMRRWRCARSISSF